MNVLDFLQEPEVFEEQFICSDKPWHVIAQSKFITFSIPKSVNHREIFSLKDGYIECHHEEISPRVAFPASTVQVIFFS